MIRPLNIRQGFLPMTTAARGFAAQSATAPIAPFSFERREPGPDDVSIEILYAGICHSDIHTARGEWPGTLYPCVPGHEIVGRVTRVGANVKKFKAGDLAGVGCMVDSCRSCSSCQEGLENYCDNGFTGTYNGNGVTNTYGGYSDHIVVDQRFVLSVSEKLDIKAVAPLLCAGITMYSPLRHWGAGKGMRVGIIGLGGLGHMGIKLAAAMGAHTTMITRSKGKEKDAASLGATDVLLSSDEKQMAQAAGTFDLLINTIPSGHDIDPYNNLLKRDGVQVVVGCVGPLSSPPNMASMILRRRTLAGSVIGGIPETQEMLDFCAEHNIVSDVEIIKPDQINEAWDRVVKSDVKYRFVIDMKAA